MEDSFKSTPMWLDAMCIAEAVFRITEPFPSKEDYGLTSQLRRAAANIPCTIAQAYGRKTEKERISFFVLSRDSVMETQSHLAYAHSVGYLKAESVSFLDSKLSLIQLDLDKMIKNGQRAK